MRSQFYVPVDGWLNRVDVRVKLFTMIAVIVMCSIWGNWVFLTAMLLAEHLFLLSTRIPARKTLKVWSFFLPVIVIVFCIMLLTVHLPGWTLWRWGSWLVTSGTMDLCAVVALRIADIVFAVFTVLFTTSRAAWISGLAGLGLPYTAGAAVTDAIQWLPTYAATVHDLVLTQHIRGRYARIGKHNPLTRTAAWCSAHARAIIAAPAHLSHLNRARQTHISASGAYASDRLDAADTGAGVHRRRNCDDGRIRVVNSPRCCVRGSSSRMSPECFSPLRVMGRHGCRAYIRRYARQST